MKKSKLIKIVIPLLLIFGLVGGVFGQGSLVLDPADNGVSVSLYSGGSLTINVNVNGVDADSIFVFSPTVGVNYPQLKKRYAISTFNGITLTNVTQGFILNLYFKKGSSYVTNPTTPALGNVHDQVNVVVSAAPSLVSLASSSVATLCSGTKVSFQALALVDRDPSYRYTWQVAPMGSSSWTTIIDGSNGYQGANSMSAAMDIVTATSHSNKQYRCIVDFKRGLVDTTDVATITTVNQSPTASVTAPLTSCMGSQKTLIVSYSDGTSPYTINLTSNATNLASGTATRAGVSSGSESFIFNTVLGTVNYTFTLTDAHGCPAP